MAGKKFFNANTEEYSPSPLREIFISLKIMIFMFRFIESKSYENTTCGKISQKTIPCWQDCRSVLPLLGRFHSTCPRFVWRLVVYLAWHSNTGQSTANNTRTCICVMVQVLWQLISSLFCFLSKDCKHNVWNYMQSILTFFIPDLAAYSSGR